MAEPHVEVRAAFVHVSVVAVLPLVALLFDDVLADLEIVAKDAPLPIRTLSSALILLTGLDLALIVGVGTCLALPALAVDELLADSVCSELDCIVGNGGDSSCFAVHSGYFVGPVVVLVAMIL